MKKLLGTIVLLAATNSFAQQIGEEVLMGAQVYGNNIKIQVRSGGCTWKHSFIVKKFFNSRQNSATLTFVRVIPDNCEAYIPEGRVFTFSTSEMKVYAGQKFNITNSFITR